MAELEEIEDVEGSTNPDPISGEPGAHPLGTGIGAAAAGAVATAIGATVGPLGAIVGAILGSVIGGLMGKSAAEATNPTIDNTYDYAAHEEHAHTGSDRSYEAYELAYHLGYEGYSLYSDGHTTYQEIEPALQRTYEARNDGSSVSWNSARYAVRDAWERARRNDFFFNEDLHWQDHYRSRPYYNPDFSYDDYQPAYRIGFQGYVEHAETHDSYEKVELKLRREYENNYGDSGLDWNQAKHAVRDAWNHAEQHFA